MGAEIRGVEWVLTFGRGRGSGGMTASLVRSVEHGGGFGVALRDGHSCPNSETRFTVH